MLRLTIPDTFKEIRMRDLKLPVNAIVGVVIRGHKVIIPHGETKLLPGDRLKIFTMIEDSDPIKNFFFS